jgi:serine/threonine protein kinase
VPTMRIRYLHSRASRHANLVFCHGLKVEHGLVYLIMERCHCSLSASSAQGKAFLATLQSGDELQRRQLCHQLLAGVSQLHSGHIIHRDLKPSNVLVTALTRPSLRLCDMGLSKRRSADMSMSTIGERNGLSLRHCVCDVPASASSVTPHNASIYTGLVTGDGVGTLGWRAPELRKVGANATEASDVFTAGLIMFHLLCNGCHAFDDDDDGGDGDGGGAAHGGSSTALAFRRQEAIDEYGREWARVRSSFVNSSSHRDLAAADKEAGRGEILDNITSRCLAQLTHIAQLTHSARAPTDTGARAQALRPNLPACRPGEAAVQTTAGGRWLRPRGRLRRAEPGSSGAAEQAAAPRPDQAPDRRRGARRHLLPVAAQR